MGETPAERNKETMASIKEELDAAPSLATYDYKAWDEDTRAFVNNVLRMYLNPGDSIAEVTATPASKQAPAKAEPAPAKTEPAVAAATATKTEEAPAKANTDDDLDSFLNDLNL